MVVTKICPKCQKKYSDVSLAFCLEDGTRLVEDKSSDALPPTVFFPQKSDERNSSGFETKPKSNSLLMFGAGVFLVALVAGALGFVFLRDKSSSQGNQSSANDVRQDYNKPDNSSNRKTSDNFANDSKNSSNECSLSDADKLSLKEISFLSTSYKIPPESETILKNLSARFKQLPNNCFVEIGVHTDNVGNESANQMLSEKRAGAIKDALVELGVSADKITAVGYGSSQPIDSNSTDEGRRKNRRTEIKLFSKDNAETNILDLKDTKNLDKLKSEGLTIVSQNPLAPGKSNPLMLVVSISPNGDLTLNTEKTGNVSDKNNLSEKLKDVFKTREEMQIYKEGTNIVEKTVTIKTPSRISREIFGKTLKIIKDANASPINLYVEN